MRNFKLILCVILISNPLLWAQKVAIFEQYSDSLSVFEKTAYAENNKLLAEYLKESSDLLEAFKKEKNDGRLISYNLKRRLLLRNEILHNPQMYEKIILSKEQELYDSLTYRRNSDDLAFRLKARSLLAERKYYEKDDDEKGTILEVFLNGYFNFTATDLHDLQGPYYGIKPWEINARLETIGFLENSEISGLLFSFGTLYNIFPETINDGTDLKVEETFFSKYLKRTGIKLGIGGRFEKEFSWHAGLGWQIYSFSIWSLYAFEERKISFAVGISDLSWVKLVLPQVN